MLIDAESLVAIEAPAGSLGGEARLLAQRRRRRPEAASPRRAIGGRGASPAGPVHLARARPADGDLAIRWVRRSRQGWTWPSGGDTPLGEERGALPARALPGAGFERIVETRRRPSISTRAASAPRTGRRAAARSRSVQTGTFARLAAGHPHPSTDTETRHDRRQRALRACPSSCPGRRRRRSFTTRRWRWSTPRCTPRSRRGRSPIRRPTPERRAELDRRRRRDRRLGRQGRRARLLDRRRLAVRRAGSRHARPGTWMRVAGCTGPAARWSDGSLPAAALVIGGQQVVGPRLAGRAKSFWRNDNRRGSAGRDRRAHCDIKVTRPDRLTTPPFSGATAGR